MMFRVLSYNWARKRDQMLTGAHNVADCVSIKYLIVTEVRNKNNLYNTNGIFMEKN